MIEEAARRKDNRSVGYDDIEKVDLYLSLGSNMGDREANIETAISLLNIELRTPYKAVSSLLETEPWGFESERKFLNAAVHYELRLKRGYNPEAEGLMILEICKDIERRLGRTEGPEYGKGGERIYHNRPRSRATRYRPWRCSTPQNNLYIRPLTTPQPSIGQP